MKYANVMSTMGLIDSHIAGQTLLKAFCLTTKRSWSLGSSFMNNKYNNKLFEQHMGQFSQKLHHRYVINRYKNASRLNCYNFRMVNAIGFLFSTSYMYYTMSLCKNILWYLAQAQCRCYEVQCPMGFKTSTT